MRETTVVPRRAPALGRRSCLCVLSPGQVFNEDRKQINGLLLVHLPDGPTAQFRLSNLVLSTDIKVGCCVGGREDSVVCGLVCCLGAIF